ncbi:MAG: hypothetical protein JWM16_6352 [Verrucomicrobiales bacterium]|nr:hypothetical protein [Verrucomicrobiales bacterium]
MASAPKNIEVPFAIQEGDAGATQNSRETLINMYAEVTTSGIAKIIRRQRPGLTSVYTLAGEKRCIEKHKSNHYLVAGSTLYKFDGTTLTTLGMLSSQTGRCTMIFNDNDQIMVSDGAVAYYWNGTILQTVTLPVGVTCGNLAYLGGYGIFNQPGTGVFWITAVNDFSTVDALDFATAESSPDNLVTVFTNHNELWLAGTGTTEIWQLSGGTDFPFTPYSNAQIERGCSAALSYGSEDNTLFFLGEDRIAYRADGYRPMRVSNVAVEKAIAAVSASGLSMTYCHLYTWRGNKFLTLTFGSELTLQYNIGTGLWNRAKTFGYDYWNVIGSAGHKSDYLLTPSGISQLAQVNKDEGSTLYRGGISAPGYASGKSLTISEFYLDAEVGRAAQGVTPQVMLRCALDGETFGNERVRTMGTTGAYSNRAVWRGLGQGRKPVLSVGVTDDFEFTITSARATVSVATR